MTRHYLSPAEQNFLKKKLETHIQSEIPKFKIRSKEKSLFMRVLSKLLFFNPSFMSDFVTTLYPYIYVPGPSLELHTLAHEYVHLKDRKNLGLYFNFLYLSPQVLGVFSILSFYSLWFMLFFNIPITSP